MRSSRVDGGRISQRCVLRVSKVAKYSPKAFSDTHPWQDFRLMYDKRGLGRKTPPLWQHIANMYPQLAGFGKIYALCIKKALQTAVWEYIS